ncbi:MAG: DUF389 domain-containing protein [Atopobiaceae bacterium]|nr:DUF389 domain-containing protein [Atopobiaceae bacterium]
MREKGIKQVVRSAFDVSKGRAKYSTIRERIESSAKIDGIHLCQLIAAMIIASIGLNIDSTEAIIGAMLICPLMGSVLELAYGIAVMDMREVRQALAGLALQCGICLVTSSLYFAFSPLETFTSELGTNSSATVWDAAIALVGGFAGGLGLSRRKEPATLVSGVAVATALMPPLCTAGYGIASGSITLTFLALYEFLTNVVFIAFGSAVVFVWLRVPLVGDMDGDGKETEAERMEAERESGPMRRALLIGALIFAVPLLYISLGVVKDSIVQGAPAEQVVDSYDTEMVSRELGVICPGFVSYRVAIEHSAEGEGPVEERVVATVSTASELDQSRRREVEALVRLHVIDLDEMRFEVIDQG